MDYSSYLQQEDQQYHQYHHHQQQQSYDSSQVQAYDHSSQSYYSYSHHHQYPYYHSSHGYSNSYAQQSQTQFHLEPTSIHPPGVPIPPEKAPSAGSDQTHLQNQQNAYYPPPGVVGSQQQLGPGLGLGSGSDQNSGLNPAAAAAVAALSQLNQFAGNMDAAQRAMHPPVLKLRGEKLEVQLLEIAQKQEADEFIIGLPKSGDGKETPQSNKVRSVAGRLAVRAAHRGWRVYLLDEHGTTRDANDRMINLGLSDSARHNNSDAYAAMMVLERYFSMSGEGTELVLPKNLDLQERLRKGPAKDIDFFPEEYDD